MKPLQKKSKTTNISKRIKEFDDAVQNDDNTHHDDTHRFAAYHKGDDDNNDRKRTFFHTDIGVENSKPKRQKTTVAEARNLSIIPLLTDINEKGEISFKVQMLRASGKFTTMVLVLHKRKRMIYINDDPKTALTKAVLNSIVTGGDINASESPIKIIDIDNLFKIEL